LVLSGVISYSAAASSAPTVIGRPKRSHVKMPLACPALSGHGHYRPCDIDSFDLTRVDAKSVYGEAAIVIGSRERVRATRAHDLAVTGLEELTLHRPCHGNFPSLSGT
jgi:hypothetical protein